MTVSILYQGITPLCTPDLLPLPGQDADEIALLHDMLSAASFFCRFTNGFTYCAAISFTS